MRASSTPVRGSRWHRIFHSLGFRLFVWLAVLIGVAFAGFAVYSIRTTSGYWRELVHLGAARTATVVRRSVHHAMLENQKEEVNEIIRAVSRAPGVVGITLYDKQGRVAFSVDPAEVGRQVDRRAEACVVCHDQDEPLRSLSTPQRARIFRTPDGERVLGLIEPIVNEASCSSAACHAHASDQTVLGILDVKLSMAQADADLGQSVQGLIVTAVLVALLVGLGSAVFIARLVNRPVRHLIEGTEQVARGELDATIALGDDGEMGRLAAAFNRMTRDLAKAREELTDWSRTLEKKVVEKTEELGRTQRQIVHMEKMASLGKLAATVAHELNNPLAGILNYAKLVGRDLEGDAALDAERRQEDVRFLRFIQKETTRCGEIVRNLLLFSRHSEARFAPESLDAVVERALMLVHHHLEMANVQLEKRLLDDDDRIVCDADQVQQALVALLVNAVEAMHEPGGVLTVQLEGRAEDVTITVADTGVGIPPEVVPHLFEPFFSTKTSAQGVGLGLAVVYGIVQRHSGDIEVDSKPGRGTTIRIRLPREPRRNP